MRMPRRAVLLAVTALVVAFSVWFFATHRVALLHAVDRAGRWAPVIYVAVYVLLTATFIPAAPLTMLGGALFGVLPGALLALVSASMAACTTFLTSRYIAHAQVSRW